MSDRAELAKRLRTEAAIWAEDLGPTEYASVLMREAANVLAGYDRQLRTLTEALDDCVGLITANIGWTERERVLDAARAALGETGEKP